MPPAPAPPNRFCAICTRARRIPSTRARSKCKSPAISPRPAPAAVAAPAAAAESHSPIPKNEGQREYLRLLDKTPVVLCAGPAGTGKTFLAVARALRGLRGGLFARLILCRPGSRGGRAIGLFARRFGAKSQSLLAPAFRRAARFGRAARNRKAHRARRDRNRAAGVYARAHLARHVSSSPTNRKTPPRRK